jgi:hypothetical protein
MNVLVVDINGSANIEIGNQRNVPIANRGNGILKGKIIMNELSENIMSVQEARECITRINSNLIDTRTLILDLYERQGWKALGYKNWRECAVTEFNQSQQYLYRQLEAAKAEKNISPIGEKIPESQLRPLTHLEPEQQREVWQKAVETAPKGKVTAKHVEETVDWVVPKNKKLGPPSNGMQFARMAILDLGKIMEDDLEREEAFNTVKQWIKDNY